VELKKRFADRPLCPNAEEGILKGKVIAVCRSAKKGQPKQDVDSGFLETGLGLVGDAHAGTTKEVSILAKEKVNQLSRKTDLSFPPGAFAENLLIEGVDERQLVPGKFLRIGRAVLFVQQIGEEPGESHPYHYRGFSLLPRFGVFARVVESGTVKNGDEVELLISFP
jgi:MOSC domain-containing protein YiiM